MKTKIFVITMVSVTVILLTSQLALCAIVFSADFEGSTPDDSNVYVTTAENMNAGTSTGSWSDVASSNPADNSGVNRIQSTTTLEEMENNYWEFGDNWNGGVTLEATMNLASPIALEGSTITFNINMLSMHTAKGGHANLIGQNADGETLFNFEFHGGSNRVSTIGTGGETKNNPFGSIVNGMSDIGAAVTVSLGNAGYTLEVVNNDVDPIDPEDFVGFTLDGSYYTPSVGDMNLVDIYAVFTGNRGRMGIDNIIVDDPTVAPPTDLNNDGVVDDQDLNLLLSDYIPAGGTTYDHARLQALLADFGSTGIPPSSAIAVPEPGSLLLTLVGLYVIPIFRSRKK